MQDGVTVVTVSTGKPAQDYYTYDQFFQSLLPVQPLVLQAIQGVSWSGLGSKPKILYKAIREGMIKTKWLIFADSWDIVFTHSPHRLLAKSNFIYRAPIVISAEKNCFPSDLKEEYDKLDIPGPYKYLNSGLIVGEVDAMMTVLEAMDLQSVPDDYRKEDGSMCHINDQFLFQQIFLKQPVEMRLDHKQLLCQTMHDVPLDDLDLTGKFIMNKHTKSYPCAVHFNGGSKTSGVREPILKHLNLL
jgi:hypothetical protein